MVATTSASEPAYTETALTRSSSVAVVVMSVLSATYDEGTASFLAPGRHQDPAMIQPLPRRGNHAAPRRLRPASAPTGGRAAHTTGARMSPVRPGPPLSDAPARRSCRRSGPLPAGVLAPPSRPAASRRPPPA